MAGRRVNQALLVLLGIAALSGWLAFAVGSPIGRWVVVAHGVAGLGIALLAPWKTTIARRGLRRSRSGTVVSVSLVAFTLVTIVSGVAMSVFGLRSVGPLTAMQVHVGSGMGALAAGIAHVVRRGAGGRPVDLGRRDFARAALLTGGALAAWTGLEGAVRLFGLPGASRRFTGSHEQGSFQPTAMPATQWIDDRVPDIDPHEWRLTVANPRGSRTFRLSELQARDESMSAVLDCTTGWWSRQEWSGVSLDDLLDTDAERSFVVISHTGYRRRFPMADASGMLLATRVGDQQLSPGHGFPARIVAPGRRGFWWVKWVVEIRADDRPWWWQGPFPLT